ncbi:hypothetical protein Acsp07_45630 [Actinomycetospora sp. NBRC 106378]|nr:hypothetical protein Acsp07_45630 [Actinomycetospora sp. NBRC 106378]
MPGVGEPPAELVGDGGVPQQLHHGSLTGVHGLVLLVSGRPDDGREGLGGGRGWCGHGGTAYRAVRTVAATTTV